MPVDVEWRDIPGYDGYQVSSAGDFRSRRPVNGRGALAQDYRPLTLGLVRNKRYLYVSVSCKRMQAHRLVLLAFAGPCPPGMQCRHLDGNPKNNRVENLAWGTPLENAADKHRHGTTARGPWMAKNRVRGERHHKAKLTEQQVREVLDSCESHAALGRRFGVNKTTIFAIRRGKNWRSVSNV
jgi:hypothetical protein